MSADVKTRPEEFEKLLTHLSETVLLNIWFISLKPGTKEPEVESGDDIKNNPRYRLTPSQVLDRLKGGGNVGIYALNGGLLFIDTDTEAGKMVLPTSVLDNFPNTLCVKSRNGGLQYYYLNNGAFENKVHFYNGVKAGEIRANWYYVVAPGSYVRPDNDAIPGADGVYRVVNDAQIVDLVKLPDGIIVKETPLRKEINVEQKQTWKNDLGMPLYEIRKKDKNLDELLKGANTCGHPSRSEADMAAATRLWFWRFNESEIAGILREYRPYEKTMRTDYLEATISKITNGDRHEPRQKYNRTGSKTEGVMELVESVQEKTPLIFDESKTYWTWLNSNERHYKRTDETGVLLKVFDNIGDTDIIKNEYKNQVLEAMRLKGRQRFNKFVLDVPKHWIQFANGVFDIETKAMSEATPEYFFTSPIPHKIGASTDTPTIDRLFEQWVGADKKQILYEMCAYCLYDGYPIHRVFALVGRGRNGKGQFMQLLERFIGKDNTTSTDLERIIESRFEASKLYKKKAAFITETNFNVLKRTAQFKQLTGEDKISGEFKHRDPFDFVNTAKIIISTNSLPITEDKTDGFYSRWYIIEFPNQFDNGVSIIDTIPEAEYENLAAKCLGMLPELLKRGKFTHEGTIQNRAKKYEDTSNPVKLFIDIFCSKNGSYKEATWRLWEKYNEFATAKGFRPLTKQAFNDILKDSYEIEKKNIDGHCWVWVYGLKLKDDGQPEQPQNLSKNDGTIYSKEDKNTQSQKTAVLSDLSKLSTDSHCSSYKELIQKSDNLDDLDKQTPSKCDLSGGKSQISPDQIEVIAHIRNELLLQSSYFPNGINEHLITSQAYRWEGATEERIKAAIDHLIQQGDIQIISQDAKGTRYIKWIGG